MMTGSLFGDNEEMIKMDIELEHLPEFDSKDILELEKASLGFYVSGHPLDEYREQIEKINYTLSSQIEDLDDGSQAIFVGKIENIVEKISKKGNKFGIATIMDFHGNIELMLFEDRLKELKEEYNLDEPIAFKVRISKDENFTRMSILKIETILDAQKEKVKTKQKEIQEPPMTIAIPFSDNENLMYKLYELVVNNQGKRELKLLIKSKLADLELETGIKVSTNLEALLHQIEGAYIVDETHTTDK